MNDRGVVLEARRLTKRFGHVTALDATDFALYRGEVLGVVGDNGAGKSTLIHVLSGALVPDDGELLLEGLRVSFGTPQDARRCGIETVYQDLALVPALDVAANLFLGRELRRPGLAGSLFRRLDERAMRHEAQAKLEALGIGVSSVARPVEELSGGQRQGVAIARAAAFAARIVVLDEPTSALGVRESDAVLELMRRIRDSGVSVVFVSHNLPHVFAIADRIHVQRLGARAAIAAPGTHSMADVVALMTGAADAPWNGTRLDSLEHHDG